MQELITAIHLYSSFSGGNLHHSQLLNLALQAGIDLVITTDQNVLAQNIDGYAQQDGKTCLLLAGEELFPRHPCTASTHLLLILLNLLSLLSFQSSVEYFAACLPRLPCALFFSPDSQN